MSEEPKVRMTFTGILKVIFFPFLFMVNPKVFYPEDADDEVGSGDLRKDSAPGADAEPGVNSGGDAG